MRYISAGKLLKAMAFSYFVKGLKLQTLKDNTGALVHYYTMILFPVESVSTLLASRSRHRKQKLFGRLP